MRKTRSPRRVKRSTVGAVVSQQIQGVRRSLVQDADKIHDMLYLMAQQQRKRNWKTVSGRLQAAEDNLADAVLNLARAAAAAKNLV